VVVSFLAIFFIQRYSNQTCTWFGFWLLLPSTPLEKYSSFFHCIKQGLKLSWHNLKISPLLRYATRFLGLPAACRNMKSAFVARAALDPPSGPTLHLLERSSIEQYYCLIVCVFALGWMLICYIVTRARADSWASPDAQNHLIIFRLSVFHSNAIPLFFSFPPYSKGKYSWANGAIKSVYQTQLSIKWSNYTTALYEQYLEA